MLICEKRLFAVVKANFYNFIFMYTKQYFNLYQKSMQLKCFHFYCANIIEMIKSS